MKNVIIYYTMIRKLSEKVFNRYITPVVLAWLVYITASLMSPNNVATTEKYNISMAFLALLLATLFVPLLAIWLYAISGWRRFFEFSRTLRERAKRRGYYMISVGLLIIAMHIIVVPILTSLFILAGGDRTDAAYVIVKNYENAFSTLASFVFMFAGSAILLRSVRQKIPLLTKILNACVPVFLFSVFYAFLVFSNPIREISNDVLVPATYYLPDILIATTIMLPVIVTWLLGLMTVINMEHYSRYTKTTNRQGVISFFNGILLIIASTVISQIVSSLGESRTGGLSLGVILVIVYVLLGLIGFGFALISRGARRLKPQKTSYLRGVRS